MGVTGTLKTLSPPEINIVENIYGIQNFTIIPSVFGPNKRQFHSEADIFIEKS